MHRLIRTLAITLAASLISTAGAKALVGEDKPWQIHNLSINALPANTTKLNETQYITFTVVDSNLAGGLNFTTNCTNSLPVGQSLFSNGYTRCNFTDAGFSLRQEGVLWFHRQYKNGEAPPWDYTTCTGNVDLTKTPSYSNGPDGMTVSESLFNIACTQMS